MLFKLAECVAAVWGRIYSYSLSGHLHGLRGGLYSSWLCASTRQGWKNVTFGYPVGSLHGVRYIKIGKGATVGKRSVIAAYDSFRGVSFNPVVEIGEGARLGEDTNIACINHVRIGRNVLFGRRVTVNDNNHGDTDRESLSLPPMSRALSSKGGVIIGDNVWIGDKATVLSGVTIGEGAVVGANSVVTRDVAPYTVVGGIPAREIAKRRASV